MNASGDETLYVDVESSTSVVDAASTAVYRVVLPVICTSGVAGILLTLIVLSLHQANGLAAKNVSETRPISC